MRNFVGAGRMLDRIEILTFEQTGEKEYGWKKQVDSWGQIDLQAARSLFSTNGLMAPGVRICLRKRALRLHQAIRWNGRHCFLTSTKEASRQYLEITAALVNPVTCRAYRSTTVNDQHNRPQPGEPELIATFPAVLTEKYLRHSQEEPMSVVEACYILVTPKAIQLSSGNLVEIAGKRYPVTLCHTLESHKNEYELLREENP